MLFTSNELSVRRNTIKSAFSIKSDPFEIADALTISEDDDLFGLIRLTMKSIHIFQNIPYIQK